MDNNATEEQLLMDSILFYNTEYFRWLISKPDIDVNMSTRDVLIALHL